MHPSNKITLETLHDCVYWHQPTEEKAVRYKKIADACYLFMETVLENSPDCADRSDALRMARKSRMMANSAIALEPISP